MNDDKILQEDNRAGPSRKKLIFFFSTTFCIVVLAFFPAILRISYPSASETIIRQAAALQLDMDPNELTSADFDKIEHLDLLGKKISDVRMLERFKNLKTLSLSVSISSNSCISRFAGFLKKLGIPDISQKTSISLKSLGKLSNLKTLILQGSEIKNIVPLARLDNLEILYLLNTQVDSIKPLSNLANLKEIYIGRDSGIADLEPIKKIRNLKRLNLAWCDKIYNEQIDDLRKSLPNVTIQYRTAHEVDVRLITITPAPLQLQ